MSKSMVQHARRLLGIGVWLMAPAIALLFVVAGLMFMGLM